ncbi:MAG TPA: ribonuclease J [Polyangiaceae bacterium]|nr:ribonuclease J [Polyangiaceae bacterium]
MADARVRIVPLGGLGEVGMNCMAVVAGGRAVVIDCGVTFADAHLGVDVTHADLSFLDHVQLAGVVLTHGHEDHIGALPYLLRRHDVPVFGPAYALALVRERLREHEVLAHARLVERRVREPYDVGPLRVEHVRVTHSIADATALALRTPAGLVIHSGDFKFDESPPDGEAFDEERLRALGDEGVALLLSDSTNIESEGSAGSEAGVGEALLRVTQATPGAVVVGMFASNVHRLRLLGEVARKTRRKLVLLGRSVRTHAKVAHATGYLAWESDATFRDSRLAELPRSAILAVATGTQAEEQAALAKLARGEHPHLTLGPGDAVVMSSRVIPGREPEAYAMLSALVRRGVTLHTRSTDRGLHVSGHAHRDEQRRLLELVRPRAFIPVHGTRVHLERHAALAREAGVGDVTVLENGQTAWLDAHGLSRGDDVPAGRVPTYAKRAIAPAVLDDRRALASSGLASCVLFVGPRGAPSAEPRVTLTGVVEASGEERILRDAREELTRDLEALGPPLTDERLSECAGAAVRRVVGKALGKRPLTVVHVVRTP